MIIFIRALNAHLWWCAQVLALVTLSWSSDSTNKQPIPSANYYKIEGLVAGESLSGPSNEGTNNKVLRTFT